jgi:transcriptional regulator with XRE-family HTH domain
MTDEGVTPTDWPKMVSDVLAEARRHAGNGPLLAEELHRLGVGPDGRYSESAISNWIKGRAMPPADVLLAAAALGAISLDDRLGAPQPEADEMPVDALAEDVRRLNRQLAQMQARVMHLYSRMGEAYPHDQADDERVDRTKKAAG